MVRFGRLVLAGVIVVALCLGPAGPAEAATPADAVNDAVGYASARSVTSFISVLDRDTGRVAAQTGNAQSQVASESIMKLLLASYYLVLYGGWSSTPDAVKNQLSYMLRYSDDATASALFSANAVPTIAGRYGLGNTSNATDRVGHWGAVRITAADMTHFLFEASQDPEVGPWLLPVMAQTAPSGSDGFNQSFGLNALSGDHGSKQGWGCDSFWTSPSCAIHSVGYTDRYFVAVLQLSNDYPDPMRDTATHAAATIQESTSAASCSAGQGGDPIPMSGVAAVRTDSGTIVFVHGTDDGVWFRSADPNQGFATLGGRTVFGPAAASWGGNRLDLFVVGTDCHLYHDAGSFDGPWNGWEDLGGTLTASPAVLSFAPGTLGVYARGADGQLWSISWTGTGWTSWSPKGGALTSGPGAVVDRDSGQATVGVRGTDGTLWELRFGSEGPGGYTSVGTAVSSAPAYAARLGDGDRRIVAYRASDGCVSVGGTRIGGIVTSAPALVLDPTGSGVSAFARGSDGGLWVYRGVPGSGSWSTLGGQLG